MTRTDATQGEATSAPWHATVLTLFPAMFPGPLGVSLAGKALASGRWRLDTLDIRAFARDKHRSVDDTPFGGGAGMVLKPDVIADALAAAQAGSPPGGSGGGSARRLIYLSPRGRVFDQAEARRWSELPGIVLLCGRYEGVDQRALDVCGVEEISLGDFVLSGGELAAMALLDATVRLLPGVMGNLGSAEEESFGAAFGGTLLEHPQYTRPAVWTDANGIDHAVPEPLLSGHHARVAAWRRTEAERLTRDRRPDLWDRYQDSRHPEAATPGLGGVDPIDPPATQ